MPYAEVNGTKIHYEIDGEGETLLLLHGVRGTLRNWDFLRPHLRNHFQIIMPDSRGHGESTELSEPSTMDLYRDDMIALLDKLEISKCIVAGHSMGGFIAQELALAFPDRLTGLILICTAPMVDVEGAMAQIELGKLAFGLEPKGQSEGGIEQDGGLFREKDFGGTGPIESLSLKTWFLA